MVTFRWALGAVLALAVNAATATQYTWDFGQLGVTSGASLTFLSSPTGGPSLTAKGYRSTNSDGSGVLTNQIVMADGSWGLGVTSSGESGYPDTYMVDNASGNDVLIFDSGMSNFDWTSLNLDYIYSGSGSDASPNVTYWAGNGDNTAFTSLCLTGNGCALTNHGFTQASLTGVSTATQTLDTTKSSGRYLVISGALGAPGSDKLYDKFKIGSAGGFGNVPEPQSIALIAIGFLGMVCMRRRTWTWPKTDQGLIGA